MRPGIVVRSYVVAAAFLFLALSTAPAIAQDTTAEGRRLTLRDAIDESLTQNLDLRSEGRVVAAGREDILIALASLLPQASVASSYTLIDRDRASAVNPQRLANATLSADQVIFDEFLLANYRIARHTQDSTEAIREQVRQDVIQATGNAFVEILRAETTIRIQRDNRRVTRANLDLSKTRRDIGTGAGGEVYRWESQEANTARDLIAAEADLENTKIAMNRVLARPIEQVFLAEDVTLDNVSYTFADARVRPFLESSEQRRIVRDFLVQKDCDTRPS